MLPPLADPPSGVPGSTRLESTGASGSLPSRSLSSLDVARPPRKQRGGADEVWTGLQCDAALRLGILQGLDAGEVPIDQHRVGERPQMLGRLQLGRIRGQKE